MSRLATVHNIRFERSAGIYERLFSLPITSFNPDLGAPYPIDDLTGYAAVGALLDGCDGNVVLALSGSQPAPGLTDKLKFISVPTLTRTLELDGGEIVMRTFSNVQGVEFRLDVVPPNAAYYYINLVAPGGQAIPFVKGAVTDATCAAGACC